MMINGAGQETVKTSASNGSYNFTVSQGDEVEIFIPTFQGHVLNNRRLFLKQELLLTRQYLFFVLTVIVQVISFLQQFPFPLLRLLLVLQK